MNTYRKEEVISLMEPLYSNLKKSKRVDAAKMWEDICKDLHPDHFYLQPHYKMCVFRYFEGLPENPYWNDKAKKVVKDFESIVSRI